VLCGRGGWCKGFVLRNDEQREGTTRQLVDPDDQDAAVCAVEIGIVVRTDNAAEFARGGIEKRILVTIDDGAEVPAMVVGPVAGCFANGPGPAGAPVAVNDLQNTEVRTAPDMLPGVSEL
jgi:hypothetical protein